MKGHSFSRDGNTPSLDITQPDGPVVIELDLDRGVMYVHMEGFTVLRICRIAELKVANSSGEVIIDSTVGK